MSTNCWAIITGEYPPQPGGVGDYTRLLARALARAGNEIHVFAPPAPAYYNLSSPSGDDGVTVHRLPDHYRRSGLKFASETMARIQPDRVLVQYVPHAYGCRAMNLPFSRWVYANRRRWRIWTMFHEVSYPLRFWQPLRHQTIAVANRLMAALLLRASECIFVSIPRWETLLRGLSWRRPTPPIVRCPIPSNLPTAIDAARVAELRGRLISGPGVLVGHFGTIPSSVASLLEPIVLGTLRADSVINLLLIGEGSAAFGKGLLERFPHLQQRLHMTGSLISKEAAEHVAACDVVVQPYPDGITGRRGTAMAALALGIPLVSNLGSLSEDFWQATDALALAPSPDPESIVSEILGLISNPSGRIRMSECARRLYIERFDIQRTVDCLMAHAADRDTGETLTR